MTIAQFSVAIALLSGLSVSALGAGLALLQNENFARPGSYQLALLISLLLFAFVIGLCLMATISRTLDFRMTARKVRKRNDLTMFCLNHVQLGRISWFLFWVATLMFLFGTALFIASTGLFFAQKLL